MFRAETQPIHPLLFEERKHYVNAHGRLTDREYAKPIVIEAGCWIASNVVICGGVTIGSESVIGAGSVVTKDIPDWSLAVGNPCKVIRLITEDDIRKLFKNEEIDDDVWKIIG